MPSASCASSLRCASALVGVRVEAVDGHVEDARAEAGDESDWRRAAIASAATWDRKRHPGRTACFAEGFASTAILAGVPRWSWSAVAADGRIARCRRLLPSGADSSSRSFRRAFCWATVPPPSSSLKFWRSLMLTAPPGVPWMAGGCRPAPMCRIGTKPLWPCNSLTPRPSQPVLMIAVRIGRLPDVHRLEVRTVGIGIADALHDRELSLVPQLPKAVHAGIEAEVIVQADDLIFLVAEGRPIFVIKIISHRG